MTDNIEKLYELAGVDRKKPKCLDCFFENQSCLRSYDECPTLYPPFTDTKQLELIKWLAFEKRVSIKFTNGKWHLNTAEMGISASAKYEPFEQLLADFICNLWNDLTDTQREEVRGILQ